jgi:uncharacterized protein
MAFGAFHFTFLWHGDIIFLYGLLGLLLLAFMFRSDRTIKIWTGIIYAIFALLLTALAVLLLIADSNSPMQLDSEYVEPQT